MALCAQTRAMRASSGRPAAAAAGRRPARVQALFGFGKGEKSEKDLEKEEQYRIQQELLDKRRSGSMIKAADERRRKVSETLRDKKQARADERAALARGEMPESLAKWMPYKKEDESGLGGIVVPLNPLGMRMYDEGERFDLRSPYSDDGWVDPDETDAFAGIKNIGKKLLNFRGPQKQEERKPIIWASQWEKTQAAKRAQQQQGKKK
ncbi:MAG: hypothetical protein J3K34DRAFT_408472 [Monoraphidium minutum]|nr:MAG: hypothetical protein J3K34DRAFT_408472 [Monoraphidium minutum]